MHVFNHGIIAGSAGGVVNNAFQFDVKTDNAGTSASNQFTIPTFGAGYNYNIETDEHSLTGQTGSVTLTFSTSGTYTITITGTFPRIYFNGGGDRLKLIKTWNFGVVGWNSLLGAFNGCSNNVIDINATGDFSLVTDAGSAWLNNTSNTFFPAIDLPICTNFIFTWMGNNLDAFPDIDMSSGTVIAATWRNNGVMSSFSCRNFYAMSNGGNCFRDTTIPTSDYSDILITQNANNANNGVSFHGGTSTYNSSATSARTNLVSVKTWTITDGGLV